MRAEADGPSGAGERAAFEADRSERLGRAVECIERNLGKPFSLDEAASAAAWSLFHFHRVFSERFGLGPGSYLRLRRLSEAARDLTRGELRVRDIAEARGYGSAEAFVRSFHASFGLSPSEYRRFSAASLPLGPFVPVERPLLNLASRAGEPAVVRLDATRLAGLGRPSPLAGDGLYESAEALWREAGPPLEELSARGWGPIYRLAFSLGSPRRDGGERDEILSVAAVTLPPGLRPPAGLELFELPAGEYLRARHRGCADLLPFTHLELYASVLPRLRRRPLGGFDFDRPRPGFPRLDPGLPSYETEIFIPLEPIAR
jgi:AraC-like DNA-binding protein/predicted transcriptional regulator YdeE